MRPLALVGGAVLGVAIGLATGATGAIELGALGATVAIFALASVIDLQERRIPNRVTYPAIVATLLAAALLGEGVASLAGLAAAGGFMLLAALLGGDQLGMGDVKLSAFAGAALGIEGVPAFLVATTLSGAVLAIGILIRTGDRHATLPYGPCLALGALFALAMHQTVVS